MAENYRSYSEKYIQYGLCHRMRVGINEASEGFRRQGKRGTGEVSPFVGHPEEEGFRTHTWHSLIGWFVSVVTWVISIGVVIMWGA